MKFAATIEYLQDKEKVEALRPTHRAYLRQLLAEGRLAASGPFAEGSGALIIYEAHTAEEAEATLKADPFHAGGVFLKWTIREWMPVMANRELFPN